MNVESATWNRCFLMTTASSCLLLGLISPSVAQNVSPSEPATNSLTNSPPIPSEPNTTKPNPTVSSSSSSRQPPVSLLKEFRPIGGSGNNLQHPNFDPIPGSPEIALAPINLGRGNSPIDGPNARNISNVIAGGTGANGQNSESEDPVASAWLYVFGQFVDHDIDLETNSPSGTPINITIPANDPVFKDGGVINMTRDKRAPPPVNTIINTTAGYLDLSQLYGSDAAIANSLRNSDGTLKTATGNNQVLQIVNDQFVTGDPRVMENPELSAVTILFMREHNYLVGRLKLSNPSWTGDQLYNMAKAITTAEYQNIIYKEYLPVLIGRVLGSYSGYDPNVKAQATQEFSTAAFRVGHSQVSDTQSGIDNNGKEVFSQSLADAFFNTPEMDIENGINPLLHSLGGDSSQATDVYTVGALRNLLFAPLAGGNTDKIDLIAIDIQRERDVGIGSLNQVRSALGLSKYNSWSDLTSDKTLQTKLQTVYGNIRNIDLFMGGLAEAHVPGAVVGKTFQTIIAKQFQALRSGDRFFWLNEGFDDRTKSIIGATTLATILKRNTDIIDPQTQVFVTTTPRKHPHVAMPPLVHIQGRNRPFLNDGT